MMFEDFSFPKKGQAEAFWLSQKILGEVNSRFNYYFSELIYRVKFSDSLSPKKHILRNLNGDILIKIIIFLIKIKTPKNITDKFDFVINPSFCTFARKPEQELLCNLLELLLQEDFKICVIFRDEIIPRTIKKKLINTNIQNLSFINPEDDIESHNKKILKFISKIIAKLDYNYIANLLAQHKIHLQLSSDLLQTKIYTMLAWFWVARKIEFDIAILRVEWETYSFPIKETARWRGKRTIAFQHGVISHTLDVPVTVSRFLTFGEQSAKFLQVLNQEFSSITGQTNICNDFRVCGAIIDDIKIQTNNFEKRTILILDQSVDRAVKFNGLNSQIKALEILLEKLLIQADIDKVIIRPHPEAKISDFWICCKNNYPEKLELSHSQFKLEMDINRSSVAIGLFSGALAIAAASGLPSYWLRTPDCYHTPDLSCFDEFALSENQILEDIKQIMSSEMLYLKRQESTLKVSKVYYNENKKISLNRNFLNLFLEN
ncbi:hypothetical protein VB715_16175 [Crocosphaera sp. UHCC 0190]|uniref:hypothetical protein n=1 Tax=Crocosphaera sp. UHCC 0190 TaxID=3110246 RepID=UPI002B2018AE|nr:hypothetical protein [Crocosphaera sp. UHCC 0190]MEA5511311.1 hypothetical protein [Crocosphaera sp. UHCC 0190]